MYVGEVHLLLADCNVIAKHDIGHHQQVSVCLSSGFMTIFIHVYNLPTTSHLLFLIFGKLIRLSNLECNGL